MSQCNYCTLQELKKRYKGTDTKLLRRDDKGFALGGENVYAVPKGERLDTEKHFVAWFMEMPNKCQC